MSQKVSLELPDSVMQRAGDAAFRSGRPVEEVLMEWLEWGATWSGKSAEHYSYTPFFDEGGEVARGLQEMLRVGSDLKKDQKD